MAQIVTHISASVGALTWISIEWLKYGKPSGLGAIAGLATITPASGSVGSEVGVQITGIVATDVFTATLTVVLLKLFATLTSGLRVDEEQEQQGLDISDHDEKGYSM